MLKEIEAHSVLWAWRIQTIFWHSWLFLRINSSLSEGKSIAFFFFFLMFCYLSLPLLLILQFYSATASVSSRNHSVIHSRKVNRESTQSPSGPGSAHICIHTHTHAKDTEILMVFTPATVTKYHRLSGLNNRHLSPKVLQGISMARVWWERSSWLADCCLLAVSSHDTEKESSSLFI